jgi:hypothetical protein
MSHLQMLHLVFPLYQVPIQAEPLVQLMCNMPFNFQIMASHFDLLNYNHLGRVTCLFVYHFITQ